MKTLLSIFALRCCVGIVVSKPKICFNIAKYGFNVVEICFENIKLSFK